MNLKINEITENNAESLKQIKLLEQQGHIFQEKSKKLEEN